MGAELKPQWRNIDAAGYVIAAAHLSVICLVAVGLSVITVELLYPPTTTEYVEHHPHTEPGIVGADRSSCWATTRATYIKDHPACEACGSKTDLNVHHCESFKEHPERECDLSNCLSLCRGCHLAIGHRCDGRDKYNWSCSNPRVMEDAEVISGWLKKRGKWPVK